MKVLRRFTVGRSGSPADLPEAHDGGATASGSCEPTPRGSVFDSVSWTKRSSRITNPDGSVIFSMNDVEVPASWSQLATDIVVSKYFRKAGVPQIDPKTGKPLVDDDGKVVTGPEKSVRQVVHRLAGCWRHWGEKHGYFDSTGDAEAFYDELCYMMLHQMAAPNSPQWFNTGLNWAYGISGPPQGHWVPDPSTGEVGLADDAYSHPQPHACFIQSVEDDLVNEGGIMDLWVREARLFKYGSGTGTNFSRIRGENEPLSGGGSSSGLMSWLRIGDRAAGAIKSGGTTRRAAKMVCLDLDHPDIENFVNWKVREEIKVAALVEGMKHLSDQQKDTAEKLGLELDYDFNGEAYYTVSGQNSNNSVRVPDSFFHALEGDADWDLIGRTNGKVSRTVKAGALWNEIAFAAWRCADPGLQFDTTINAWHTCPAEGRIEASNPCVTGDTLVATSTGYRRIIDLLDRPVEIINGDGERAFVERVFKTGRKPVYRLKTRSGFELKLTGDHRVKTVNRGDVPACELTTDDVLILEEPGFGDEFLPERFAELLGAALGDGCITHTQTQDMLFVTLGESERAVAAHLRGAIEEAKGWLATGDLRSERPTNVITTSTGLRVGTSVSSVVHKLCEYAVLDERSAHKRLNDAAFALDRRSQAALLRGLFTTDGTVANYGAKSQYVSLDSTSLELLQQVQLLLLGFGIKAKIYENRRALNQQTAILPDGSGGTKQYAVKQMHSLRISRLGRLLFEREIGFLRQSDKQARLAEMNRNVTTYADPLLDNVASLTACGEEDVYDLTEPRSHHFVANGLVVHNCSEYMFLDNTACNLASINLLKFYDSGSRTFDLEAFEHAIRLWTMVLEISVLMAAYPSKEIARLSYRYRTLGLGHANVGALLMQAGIPYNSDAGRAVCGALTAILTGRAYATSAEMARAHGPFAGYHANRDNMLRVIRNHRRAAQGVSRDDESYEGLPIRPIPIDHAAMRSGAVPIANTGEILTRSTTAWNDALELGERHGYRNAQVSVLAPTGTIGLLMDCDTTGVEPDFALVKFKKLAGGGYFKIANNSLRPALEALGYSAEQIRDILRYVLGTLSLDVEIPGEGVTLAEFLTENKFKQDELEQIGDQLPGVFELAYAFSPWSLSEDLFDRLGIDAKQARQTTGFNLLAELGLSRKQIEELNRTICGTQTIEGAPHLKEQHLPVFDCANRCGKIGKRFIPTDGHIRMMAAAQSFISGAISKTINLPNEATVDDIKEAYHLSWELGLKANALYRDGCKLSQPLSNKSSDQVLADDDTEEEELEASHQEVLEEAGRLAEAVAEDKPQVVTQVVERIVERPLRRRLSDTRTSVTHKFNVAGHEGYVTVGLYDDGSPGELFITMAKEGSTIGGLMDSLGTAVSVALQYGVPIKSLVQKFSNQRFEPAGMTTNPDIPFAKSLVDYIFRWIGIQFVPGYREQAVPSAQLHRSAANTDRPAGKGGDKQSQPSVQSRMHEENDRCVPHDGLKHDSSGNAGQRRAVSSGAGDFAGQARFLTGTGLTPQQTPTTALTASMAENMGDAPPCDVCGEITVRSGTCYKCLNCGNSLGCS